MSQIDVLIKRFLTLPKDFKLEKLDKLLKHFGYTMDNCGRTSGSRIQYKRGQRKINFHKPQGSSPLKY